MMKTDILVIGGGLAGRRCAEFASKNTEVTLVCDGMGASPYVHGINIPLYKKDSVECFMNDTMESGKFQNDRKLVQVLCKESVRLESEFPFDKKDGVYDLLRPLGSTYPRVAGINSKTGVYIINKINQNKKFTELNHTRAMYLDVSENKVCGAYCFNKKEKKWFHISAKAVVLAGGGYSGIFPFSTNSADIGGDMIAMAYNAGAKLCDMEFIQFEPTTAVYPYSLKGKSVITTMLFEGAVMRNKDGDTFVNGEKLNKDQLSKSIYNEILNGKGTENGGIYFDATAVPDLKERYYTYWKRYIDTGIDITKEPMEIAPAPHTSLGGVVIDEKCRTSVEGLFACGECTGGLHGANRLGGNAGLEILVFGKIAGESALKYIKTASDISVKREIPDNISSDCGSLNDEIGRITENSLSVIRNEKDMQKAAERLEKIIKDIGDYHFNFDRTLSYNNALCALICLKASIMRKESIGCHTRADSIKENEKYRITVSKDNGYIKDVIK